MSLFQSFLGHAAGAAADIYGEKAKSQQREAEARLQEELLMKREMTIQAMREAAGIRSEERQTQSRTAERAQIFKETIENAPLKRQSIVDDLKAQKQVEYDPEIQGMATNAETTRAKAKSQAEIDFYKDNAPAILKQKRDLAQAGNIDNGAGLRGIQMEAARMSLDEKKELDKTLKAYETTEDPKEKAKLRDALILRGVIKPPGGEFETEKVIEKKTDMEKGTETTTERTQRRPRSDATNEKTYPTAPAAAVERLIKNPDKRAEYDALFGPGASDSVLKQSPKAEPKPTAAKEVKPVESSSGPKEGDTREIAAGPDRGQRLVYKRTKNGLEWVKQ